MKDFIEFWHPWIGVFCISAAMFTGLMLWEEYGQKAVWLNDYILPFIGLSLFGLTIYHAFHDD